MVKNGKMRLDDSPIYLYHSEQSRFKCDSTSYYVALSFSLDWVEKNDAVKEKKLKNFAKFD